MDGASSDGATEQSSAETAAVLPAEGQADEGEAATAGGTTAADNDNADQAAVPNEEEQFIEYWRPKRRHDGPRRDRRGRRDTGRSRQDEGSSSQTQDKSGSAGGESKGTDVQQAKRSGSGRPDRKTGGRHAGQGQRRDNRRRGGDKRRDERSKPAVHTSSPAKKSGGVDPDSPFAALGALRQAMDTDDRETKN